MDATRIVIKVLVGLPLALAVSACSQAQFDGAVGTIATASSNIASVARTIDAGSKIAAFDLPIACRITADIAAAADALSGSHLIGDARRPFLQRAASAAAALVSSDLCQNPASNAASASLQIIQAVGAIRNAAHATADLSATTIATGSAR